MEPRPYRAPLYVVHRSSSFRSISDYMTTKESCFKPGSEPYQHRICHLTIRNVDFISPFCPNAFILSRLCSYKVCTAQLRNCSWL